MDDGKKRTTAAGETGAIRAAFVADYPRAQYHCVEFLASHLADCSRTFEGDLQQMLILALIGQMHLRACLDEDGGVWQTSPTLDTSISASRLSDVTGIPRQTVRRKLQALESRGWIVQNAEGRWQIVVDDQGIPASRQALADLDNQSTERFARLHAALKRIA